LLRCQNLHLVSCLDAPLQQGSHFHLNPIVYPAHLFLIHQALSAHFEKSWASHTQMKGSLLDVLALTVRTSRRLTAFFSAFFP
jgi:hypothetical protein